MGVVASKMCWWKELLNVLLLSFVIAVISLGQYVDAGPPRRAPEKIQVQIDDSVVPAQKENQIQNEPNTEPHSEPEPYAELPSEPEPYAELPSEPEPYAELSSEPEPYAEPHSEPAPNAEPHPESETIPSEPYAEPYSEPETIPYAEPHPESETIPSEPNAEPPPEPETEPYAEPYAESETIPYADPHTGFRKHPFHEAEVQFLADSQNSNYVYASSEPYSKPHHEPEPDEGEAVVESENEQPYGAPTIPTSSESRAGAKVIPILVKLQNKYQSMNDVDKRKLIEKADVYREKFKATIDKIDDETATKYGLDKKIINTILGLDDSSNIYVPLHSEPVPEPIPEHQPEPEPTYNVPEYKVKAYSEPSQYNPNTHGHYNIEEQHGGYTDPNVQHIRDEGKYKDDRKVDGAKPGDVKSGYDHLIANKVGPIPIYSIKSGHVQDKKNTGKKSNHQMDYRKNAHIPAHKQRPDYHQYPPGYFNDPRIAEMAMRQHNHFNDFDEFSMYNDDYDLSDYLAVPPSLYSPYQQRQAHHHRQAQRGYGNRGRPRQQTGYPHRGGWM